MLGFVLKSSQWFVTFVLEIIERRGVTKTLVSNVEVLDMLELLVLIQKVSFVTDVVRKAIRQKSVAS